MDTHYDIVTLTSVGSTQDEAQERFAGSGTPTLVVAGEQIAGRGRQGRTWTQPDRGLFASLAFASDWGPSERTLIPLIAGIAMRRAVASVLDIGLGLKWPNDLKLDGAKVGGILVEASDGPVTVGCGLNVWWAEPMEGASSLTIQDPGDMVVLRIAKHWANSLVDLLTLGPLAWPRSEYEAASVTIGRDIAWSDGRGRAVGVTDTGALLVSVGDMTIELHSGEVHTTDEGG